MNSSRLVHSCSPADSSAEWISIALKRALRTGVLTAFSLLGACGGEGAPQDALQNASATRLLAEPIRPQDEMCQWLSGPGSPFLDEGLIARLQARLKAALEEGKDAQASVSIEAKLGSILMNFGQNEESISSYEKALERAQAAQLGADFLARLQRDLGVAYLRAGEKGHCIAMHNPESCLFPIEAGGVWSNTGLAEKAAASFRASLALDPGELGTRWLLNVAVMAAGSYPDSLSADELLPSRPPERAPAEELLMPRFRDIATPLGVDTISGAGGAIMDDIDGDGFLDLVVSSSMPCESMRYFHNEGDGSFSDWSERSGLSTQLGGLNIVQADYDNDGRLDLFVFRGAWMQAAFGRQINSLLQQQADGSFKDVTLAAGMGQSAFPCLAGSWADYDLDGDLDLFVGNERLPSELFQNQGDGTFVEVAQEAGVTNGGVTKGVAWGDFDNDGDPDLYVSNLGQLNKLYENRGDGTFVDVAAELGLTAAAKQAPSKKPASPGAAPLAFGGLPGEIHRTFGTWFFDANDDGWLDLFVAGYSAGLGAVASDYLGLEGKGIPMFIYMNDGTGQFVERAESMGLARERLPMGANYGDADNDGFDDIYLATGRPGFEALIPNELYRNVRGERFVDVTSVAGVGHLQKGHAVAFGDLDNDGDQDLLAQMGGFYPDDTFRDAMFLNPGNQNHWITLRLRGRDANRFGVGARIELSVARGTGADAPTRTFTAFVNSGGCFGGSSLQQELGLGSFDRILSMTIDWPAGQQQQRFEDVPVDKVFLVEEGAEKLEEIESLEVQLR